MVGPNTVVTAAHCLVKDHEWLDKIRVYYKSHGNYESADNCSRIHFV